MTDLLLLITSGVGPAEARRFTFLLASRLELLAQERGLEILEVIYQSSGDSSGECADAPRSVMLRVRGDTSLLGDELGTHVLVHRTRGRSARKRWFAGVSIHPSPRADGAIDAARIPRDSLVITACRAGGPGGQHVNKVSSAVRVQHLPSGLCIRSAGARSQKINLDRALRRLAALLRDRDESRRATAASARRDTHYRLERGRAVRTYCLDSNGHLDATGLLVAQGT